MNMQNVRFECQTISENIQKLKQEKFKDFQVLLYKFKALNFCFQIQDVDYAFKDFQVLYWTLLIREFCYSYDGNSL
jgi:hypothetical protein